MALEIKMVVKSYLARIDEIEESIFRKRGPKICFITDSLGLWTELTEDLLERLKDDFGIANDEDLVGRECTIDYETEDFKFFSETDIRSIVPYIGYTEADFAMAD